MWKTAQVTETETEALNQSPARLLKFLIRVNSFFNTPSLPIQKVLAVLVELLNQGEGEVLPARLYSLGHIQLFELLIG